MLIEFKVANYRSIRAEQTLSMVASNYSDELPQNLISCDHVPGLKGTKLVKAVALYGANASGKSNIVAALRFFAEFVIDSATELKPDAPTGAQPFKLDPDFLTEPSKFEITAVIDGIRTLYGIGMTRERVTSEYLVAYPKGRPQVWFERDWDAAKEKYEWSSSGPHFKVDASLQAAVRHNASFIATATQLNHEKAKKVWDWFFIQFDFLDLANSTPPMRPAVQYLNDTNSREAFRALIKSADLGIQEASVKLETGALLERLENRGVKWGETKIEEIRKMADEVKEQPIGDDEAAEPVLFHASKGSSSPLDFSTEESTGTRRLFALLGYVFECYYCGTTLAADELESSLHPTLITSLLTAFLNFSEFEGGQLIFTTHNPLLLDQTLLRRDQIWFTEKDQEGATRLYPLTDFKPRKDESLVKGYLAGRYGGIPFIPDGLKF